MKLTVVILVLILFMLNAYGQKNNVHIGLIGSVETQYYRPNQNGTSNYSSYESVSAYSVGLHFEYKFSNKVFIKSGLLHSNQRFKVKYHWLAPDGTAGVEDPFIQKKTLLVFLR